MGRRFRFARRAVVALFLLATFVGVRLVGAAAHVAFHAGCRAGSGSPAYRQAVAYEAPGSCPVCALDALEAPDAPSAPSLAPLLRAVAVLPAPTPAPDALRAVGAAPRTRGPPVPA